eukprot:scaffold104942_cov47-Phaeocystis_antarctica.AAC.2
MGWAAVFCDSVRIAPLKFRRLGSGLGYKNRWRSSRSPPVRYPAHQNALRPAASARRRARRAPRDAGARASSAARAAAGARAHLAAHLAPRRQRHLLDGGRPDRRSLRSVALPVAGDAVLAQAPDGGRAARRRLRPHLPPRLRLWHHPCGHRRRRSLRRLSG